MKGPGKAKPFAGLSATGLVFALVSLAFPADAWEFSQRSGLCRLDAVAASVAWEVTYDPGLGEYAISLTRAAPWPGIAVFGIVFEGPAARTITTTRHGLSDGDRRLTVRDRGFGNLLAGLEFNHTATAVAGEVRATANLVDPRPAAPEVGKFRACTAARLS